MLYHLFYPLAKYFSVFNVSRYITFRGGFAFVTAFVLVMAFWKITLKRLLYLKLTERIDMYGHIYLEALHNGKRGTPTMGGILIIFAIAVSVLLWARWDNFFIWLTLLVMCSLGVIGFCDDYTKTKHGKGLSRWRKLFWQGVVGAVLGLMLVFYKDFQATWTFPFFKKIVIDLGYYYIFWFMLMIIATSNAVNFTDGLDGLAIGTLIINFLIIGLISYLAGHIKFASYLYIPYIPQAGELTVFCLAAIGASLAFLWFNSYPAEVFMGDVGALALGGVIGAIALFIKQEFLLFISGGIFVAEAISVILQILSVKIRKKKLFKAAPLHHHFQLLGWKEPKIIIRFWIVSIFCAVITLLTLKLR